MRYEQPPKLYDHLISKLGLLAGKIIGTGICMIGEFNEGMQYESLKQTSKPDYDPLEYI